MMIDSEELKKWLEQECDIWDKGAKKVACEPGREWDKFDVGRSCILKVINKITELEQKQEERLRTKTHPAMLGDYKHDERD